MSGSDERQFVEAMRIAACHCTADEFDDLLAAASDRSLNAVEQWGVAEAVIVMIQSRGIVPKTAPSALLAMTAAEPAAASRAEALELIRQRRPL